jgi:predicted kinase
MTDPGTPTLIVVSGPPRTGKTTLAQAIARELPCPAVCRDEIKEGMVHAAGDDFRAAAGDPLTQRTLPVFFEIIGTLLSAGVTTVAEAAFQDRLWRHGLDPLLGHARLRIVQCHASPASGRERRRLAVEGGQTAHATIIGDEVDDWRRAYAEFDRLSLPAPSLDVDTTDGYAPGIEAIIAFVNEG